jgi:tellurite resistance protein
MLTRMWSWLRTQFEPKPDPQLEALVRWYAQQVSDRLIAWQAGFDLATTLAELEAEPEFHEAIADRAYRLFLRRAWSDGTVTEREQKTLAWVASKLEIDPVRAAEINDYTATSLFTRLLDKALQDGVLTADELSQLSRVAKSAGRPLADFASAHLHQSGRTLLERWIGRAATDDHIDEAGWRGLFQIGEQLGLSRRDYLECLKHASTQLLDNVIDRIRADGKLEDAERRLVSEIIDRLELGPAAHDRLARAAARLTLISPCPPLSAPELAKRLNACAPNEALKPSFSASWKDIDELRERGLRATWWEIVHAETVNAKYNAGAASTVNRSRVSVRSNPPRALLIEHPLLSLTGNFGTLYFLPVGLLRLHPGGRFTGTNYSEIERSRVQFVESGAASPGATVIGHTWQYVNKQGGPDMRFADNPRLPICLYGAIKVPSSRIELKASVPDIFDVLPAR